MHHQLTEEVIQQHITCMLHELPTYIYLVATPANTKHQATVMTTDTDNDSGQYCTSHSKLFSCPLPNYYTLQDTSSQPPEGCLPYYGGICTISFRFNACRPSMPTLLCKSYLCPLCLRAHNIFNSGQANAILLNRDLSVMCCLFSWFWCAYFLVLSSMQLVKYFYLSQLKFMLNKSKHDAPSLLDQKMPGVHGS